MYKDLSMHNDWPILKVNVDLPFKLKGNSCNSLSPLGAHNKDLSAASQMLLTVVRLHLQCRVHTFYEYQ